MKHVANAGLENVASVAIVPALFPQERVVKDIANASLDAFAGVVMVPATSPPGARRDIYRDCRPGEARWCCDGADRLSSPGARRGRDRDRRLGSSSKGDDCARNISPQERVVKDIAKAGLEENVCVAIVLTHIIPQERAVKYISNAGLEEPHLLMLRACRTSRSLTL